MKTTAETAATTGPSRSGVRRRGALLARSPVTGRSVPRGFPGPHRLGPVQKVRGVVARAKGAPVSVETVLVPDPGPGEALVRVQACGVCHTDLHYREGAIND